MLDVASGQVVVAMTNMNASGEVYTFKTGEEARIEVFNGRFNNMKKTLASAADAPRVGVATSEDGVSRCIRSPAPLCIQARLPVSTSRRFIRESILR